MAKSFWSKRKETMSRAGGYMKATDTVSRPTALLMTILGIIVVGGLFFAVFWGARWSFEQLANNDSGSSQTSDQTSDNGSSTNGASSGSGETSSTETSGGSPPITATSSTSTTTPSTPPPVAVAPTTVPATSSNLPHTGPGSTTAFFFAMLIISYLAYRKRLTKE
jgi:cytoskeletal protein RodZ